jgi:ATP-binding cassette, subfamily B, bacterial
VLITDTFPELFIGKRRFILFRLIANGLCQALAALAGASAIRLIFDHDISGRNSTELTSLLAMPAFVVMVSALLGALLKWHERVDSERLGQEYARDIRLSLFDYLSRLSARKLQQRRQGGLVLRFVGDMTALRHWASRGVSRIWVATMMSIGVMCGLFYLNAWFGIIVLITISLGGTATWYFGEVLEQRVRNSRSRQGQLAANINEKLSRLPVIQAFGQRHNESKKISRQSQKLLDSMMARARVAGLILGIAAFTASSASFGIILLGIGMGNISRGTILAGVTLMSLLVTPIHQLGLIAELWRSAKLARQKLNEVFQLGSPIINADQAMVLRKGKGKIVFDKVAVKGALSAFSAIALSGQRVVITGQHGSGKSTLLGLVMRLIEPDHGRVLIDNSDISQCTLGSLRRAVAMVSADLPLLRGSLRMNLSYRKPDANDAELWNILSLCNAVELVEKLPGGLDTVLSESANNFSQGERRRLMMARALLGKPRILLIDDVDVYLESGSNDWLLSLLNNYVGTILMTSQSSGIDGVAHAVWKLSHEKEVLVPIGREADRGGNDNVDSFAKENA